MTQAPQRKPARPVLASTAAATAALALLAGCSTVDGWFSADKYDYRTTHTRATGLEVPPDLTQLARDGRYQPTGGAPVTASQQAQARQPGQPAAMAPTSGGTQAVAPSAVGDTKMMRDGQTRWLSTTLPAEQVARLTRAFWSEMGFTLETDQPQVGVMVTDWAENRAKLPLDIIRNTLGKVFSSLYSTGELDRFRTRFERNASGGTDIYLTHQGMVETVNQRMDGTTVWQPRAADPQLEAEFLQRLMVRLGAPEGSKVAAAKAPVAGTATAPSTPATASTADVVRPLDGQAALLLADSFDRAWRQVGLALDRSGFTVEDRDRSGGVYFIRYVDPAGQRAEPGFFDKLFNREQAIAAVRYRVQVKPEAGGQQVRVSVLDGNGAADNSAIARNIVTRLGENLR